MSGFENYDRETAELELELQRKGVALNIDWNNAAQVREIARAALHCKPATMDCDHHDPEQMARFALYGIAQLMLRVMTESARDEIHSHGGPVWKTFARSLWAEHDAQVAIEKVGSGETAP
jgi:hypothetical protein